jgi:hypothetical protein
LQDELEVQLRELFGGDAVDTMLLADVASPSATLQAVPLQLTLKGKRLAGSLSSILQALQRSG